MADFLVYCLFMFIGIFVSAFCCYFGVNALWRGTQSKNEWIKFIVTAIAAILGMSR